MLFLKAGGSTLSAKTSRGRKIAANEEWFKEIPSGTRLMVAGDAHSGSR